MKPLPHPVEALDEHGPKHSAFDAFVPLAMPRHDLTPSFVDVFNGLKMKP